MALEIECANIFGPAMAIAHWSVQITKQGEAKKYFAWFQLLSVVWSDPRQGIMWQIENELPCLLQLEILWSIITWGASHYYCDFVEHVFSSSLSQSFWGKLSHVIVVRVFHVFLVQWIVILLSGSGGILTTTMRHGTDTSSLTWHVHSIITLQAKIKSWKLLNEALPLRRPNDERS